jgi:hypothetical protein
MEKARIFPFLTPTSSFVPIFDPVPLLFPGAPLVCPTPNPEPLAREVDPEERRWQLEWERRNIED